MVQDISSKKLLSNYPLYSYIEFQASLKQRQLPDDWKYASISYNPCSSYSYIDILKWSRSTISSCMQTTGLASYNLLATATAIAIHFAFFYLCTP